MSNASMSMFQDEIVLVCAKFDGRVASKGIFFGEDPLKFPFPILIFQLGLVSFLSGTFRVLLKPFRQPNFVADILGGILLGPSFLGHNENFLRIIFPQESQMAVNTCGRLGIVFFTFLVGIRTDVNVMKNAGGISLIIGIASFFLPLLITTSAAIFLTSSNPNLDKDFTNTIGILGYLQSIVNFHGIYGILSELKLLNSELGRLALSSSMTSTICAWFFAVVFKTVIGVRRTGLAKNVVGPVFFRFVFLAFVVCVWRPLMFWMIKRTPEGKTLKEQYVCTISIIVLVGILYCDAMGLETTFGTIVLGMAVPGGTTLCSGLVDKLELFVSAVLLPSFILTAARRFNVHDITWGSFWKVELLICGAFFGKVVGTMVPSIYRRIPVADAFLIGLLMCCQGLMDISFFTYAERIGHITKESFEISVLMAILHAGMIKPLVKYLYDPSRKYAAYKVRTIQHAVRNTELRILACVCHEENVPAIINILEASNPTRVSPIGVYVVELVELVGQALPLLINHQKTKPSHSNTRSDRIVNAFHQYQMRNQGFVAMQCFTSIAPFATIHDDICSLARQKITSLVIIPFQKSDGSALRVVQRNVLRHASCSVAILVDRAQGVLKPHKTMTASWFALHVCVIFLGGPDDREALAYGTRMAEHPNVKITVVRIYEIGHQEYELVETQLDLDAVNDYRIVHADNSRAEYQEVGVSEGPETAEVLHSLSVGFDLMLVGRRREEGSSLLMGLSQWCEIKELGVIGDILTSSDYKSDASVLVVQQQGPEADQFTHSIHFSKQLL